MPPGSSPSERLRLAPTPAAGAGAIAVRGRLDLASAPRLQAALRATAGAGERVVLDLCDVRGVDGDGVILLLHALRRAVRAGGAATVVCPPDSLHELIERGGLGSRVELVGDRAALTAAAASPARVAAAGDAGDGRDAAGTRGARPDTPERRGALLAEATLALERRHAEAGLSLADVAREIATSERQLQRVFAELAGTSFRDELVAVRMERAARLLSTTVIPVGAIAGAVGYRQPAQFAKAFRRDQGCSPTEFRAMAPRPPREGAA